MSQRISSSFPGGPGRRAEEPVASASERVKRLQEIEHRIAERRLYLRRRVRWHRARVAVTVSAVLAAGAALYLSL